MHYPMSDMGNIGEPARYRNKHKYFFCPWHGLTSHLNMDYASLDVNQTLESKPCKAKDTTEFRILRPTCPEAETTVSEAKQKTGALPGLPLPSALLKRRCRGRGMECRSDCAWLVFFGTFWSAKHKGVLQCEVLAAFYLYFVSLLLHYCGPGKNSWAVWFWLLDTFGHILF